MAACWRLLRTWPWVLAGFTWLECEPVLLRRTRTLVFAQGVCMADGKPVLRASGVFGLPKDPPAQPSGG